MGSKGFKMPVSESEKMDASVLGSRLSEKAGHLPIKKRRFLFMNSSPSVNTSSTEETKSVAACPQPTSQDARPKPDANCAPAATLTVPVHQSESYDSKQNVQKFMNSSMNIIKEKDTSGTTIAPGTVEFKANNVKLENMSAKDTDSPISTAASKDVASCTPDESTLSNSSSDAKRNEATNDAQNFAALDDRLNWDLNTVMAWEEPVESDHNMNNSKEGKSKNIRDEIPPVSLKSLVPKIERSELEERKSVSNGISKLSSHVINNTPLDAANKINFVHNQNANRPFLGAVPSALTLKYPPCEISTKRANVTAAGTNFTFTPSGFGHGTDIPTSGKNVVSSKIIGSGSNVNHSIDKLDLSLLTAPSLENRVHQNENTSNEDNKANVKRLITSNVNAMGNSISRGMESSRNVLVSSSNVNAIGNPISRCMESPTNILVSSSNVNATSDSISRGTESSRNVLVSSSSMNAMGNWISRGMESSQNVYVSSKSVGSGNLAAVQTSENETLNLSLVTAASAETVAHKTGSVVDDEDDKAKVQRVITNKGISMEKKSPAAVSSMHDVVCSNTKAPLQSGTSFRNDIRSCKKEVCDHENIPSDVQAGSEVDNIDEISYGYDSQFEDGEFRDSSIQTCEGNDGEDREIEHGTENRGGSGISTRENGSLRSTDVGSQKGTDEISSVIFPEKPDTSDQISGSEPNMTEAGTCTIEVNMKDASQSDQWKMNVSGPDLLPENHSSSGKIKDLSSIKSSCGITEDLETKTEVSRLYRRDPSARDAFLSRSRFHMQGSSSNVDGSGPRSVRDAGVIRSGGRGRYTRGGATWDRSPPFPGPSFRRSLPEDVDDLTDKVGVDPNMTRRPFRSRLMVNSEEDEFRARLGLRPSGETFNNRFGNVGRGRPMRFGSRYNDVGPGPRGRYYGHPANDEPLMDYPRPFPVRNRVFSPPRHASGSTSPPRSRTRSPIGDGFGRSRSPNSRPDTRMRREPGYRHDFESDHVGGYNPEQSRNNSPPSSRFLKYKQRSFLFDRRSPPPPGSGERLGFYERKPKANENYRSSQFSEVHGRGRDGGEMDHGFRRGGFVRPFEMGRPVKHIPYNEEDGYGGHPVFDSRDKEGLEFHERGNPKGYDNGSDSRFRELPRRSREEREKW